VSTDARERTPWADLARWVVPGVIVFSITVRVVVGISVVADLADGDSTSGYIDRFAEIATDPGRPYRDRDVEYPPVSLVAIVLVGTPEEGSTGIRVLWLTLALDAAVALSLLWGWGARATAAYLGASLPVLVPMYTTLDLLPVALASWAVALAWRRRERAGGALLAAAILAKVWPVVLVPGLVVWGRRRALAWAVGALAVGTLLWVSWGGVGALGQVATQRHTPGWEAESTVGAIVWIVGDERVQNVRDSPRVGAAPAWAKLALLGATALGVAAVWIRAARRGAPVEVGAPSLACVAVLLFCSPIYSYPYVLWLLPWTALALVEGRRALGWLGVAVIVFTAVTFELLTDGTVPVQIALVTRNLLTGAIPVVYLVARSNVRTTTAVEPAPTGP
jgi:hypothetical protein